VGGRRVCRGCDGRNRMLNGILAEMGCIVDQGIWRICEEIVWIQKQNMLRRMWFENQSESRTATQLLW
jgi:hypothetical protein